ncbi:MAG: hypothetical protein JJ916_11080, partial [Phycisphaerales bacterium]|nr:hypothetical protein [Phycisphaerales bacterium]
MSTLDARQSRLTADDRYELAMRAQNQQRLNSPKHLIVLGILLLVVSLVAFGVAWQTQRSALEKNERSSIARSICPRSIATTRPAPIFVWPTSELPICPLG